MPPPEFHFRGVTYTPHAGGHSGAAVFVGSFENTPAFAVKRHTIPADRLRWVHEKLRVAPAFVPKPVATTDGRTVVEWDGATWDCVPWADGVAVRPPTAGQKAAAFAALAELHRCWPVETVLPFPAVRRRLEVLRPAVRTPAVRERVARGVARLAPYESVRVPCRPCVCDGHAEHFLFTADTLTAVIDFAAMKLDHPAVDVARLAEDWDVPATEATAVYRDAGGLPEVTAELVEILAETGTLAAWRHWQTRPGGGERVARLRRRLFGP